MIIQNNQYSKKQKPNLYKPKFQNSIMGTAIIKMKIMPTSPDIDLKEIEEKAKGIIKEQTNSDIKIEKEPIAFGLTALHFLFAWDESKDTDNLQDKLKNIPEVSSAEIVDFRRAIG